MTKCPTRELSETLINLLIPHLSLPILHTQSLEQQSPALQQPINHLKNELPCITSSAPLATAHQLIDPHPGCATQGWETEARARESQCTNSCHQILTLDFSQGDLYPARDRRRPRTTLPTVIFPGICFLPLSEKLVGFPSHLYFFLFTYEDSPLSVAFSIYLLS